MSESERLVENEAPPEPTSPTADTGGEGDAPPVVSEREAYFQALRLWIQQAQMYQNLSTCFPYYMMTFQGLQNNASNVPLLNNNYQFQVQQFPFQIPNVNRIIGDAPPQPETLTPAEGLQLTTTCLLLRNDVVYDKAYTVNTNSLMEDRQIIVIVISRNGGYEYVIPSLHKRLLAEFIDFMLLFILKLIVTFIAVDMFEMIDLEKFDFYKFSERYDDYKYAMELTSEILFLEIIYRILVCIYEAFCLSRSVGRTGGATPGKALLGLRVVTASAVISVEGRPRETVLLYPGSPLTFAIALARSLLKNFLISLLFPLCVVLFVFKHNRTGYDLLCGVIVVEENMFPPRRHAP